MTISRVALSFFGFLCLFVLFSPVYLSGKSYIRSASPNSPPVANNDTYNRHGNGTIGPLLANDSDPDGDTMNVQLVTLPTHGSLSGLDGNSFSYQLNVLSFVGTDSFTYKVCAAGQCSNVATVTINVVNQTPTAVNDSYTVHGGTIIGPMMVNDFDPDGDTITWSFLSPPSHGTVFGLANPPFSPDTKSFVPTHGYVGPDSFTYRVCDLLGLCSAPATVNLNIVNNPPTLGFDIYLVRGATIIGPLKENDTDPDGDSMGAVSIVVGASHGTVFGLPFPQFPEDVKQYVPDAGYFGFDSFTYRVCDFLGQCSTTTVTLFVIGDGSNAGPTECPLQQSVGQPVNVTNGNMYLQQSDYHLPGAGAPISITRTYNSQSSTIGLFGRGWSTDYDEAIVSYDNNLKRPNEPSGRATYFGRAVGSSGPFLPLAGNFYGQLTQTTGGYTLALKDGTTKQFNTAGKLLSITDRNGNQTTLAYNLSGKLSSVTDPFGRILSFLININGSVISIADTTGIVADYTYGAGGELLSVTYADNSAFSFGYDGSLRLTSVTDALGNVLESHTYDAQGRALTSAKHGGVELYTLNYVSATETHVTDALNRVTKYTYDTSRSRNNVTRVEGTCNCGGGSQIRTWSYDNKLNVLSETDALNNTTSYTYDTNGNRLTKTDPTGTITFTYNPFGQVLTRTDQLGGVTTNTYNAQGNLLTTTDALNNTTTFTYDSRGHLLTSTDARSKVTTLTWDSTGRLIQEKDALNNITTYAYNQRAWLTSNTNALSQTTNYEYDAAGRLKKVIYPDTSFVQFTYDLAGRRTKIRDPRGYETNFVYDAAYRLISKTDAAMQVTSFGYDLMSNLTSVTDALSRVTDYEYDDFDRLKKIVYPPAISGGSRLQATIEYDVVGNLKKKIDTAGRETTYLYDAANRLTRITDPALQATQFEYNARSQATKVIDALNQQYQFSYDALGRVTQVTRAGVSMSSVYDAVGNRTQRTDYNGAVTNYTFDDLNRLSTIAYPDSTSATYSYDGLSRLTSAANQSGSVSFVYDVRGQVSSTTDVWGQTVGYSYDATGNRVGLTVGGAAYATYQYDAINRLTNLTDNASQNFAYTYNAVNRLTSRVAPNGVTTNVTYDGLDRVFELSYTKAPATLANHQYAYNNANNIISWLGSSGNRSFNYDSVDRVTSALKMGGNESYGYDAVGNRTNSHLSGSYSYQPFNRLASTATATYTYDNNGNMLTKTDGSGTRTFGWDSESRLKQVLLPGGLTVNYKYDALGRRIQRTTSAGADERFVYDSQDVLLDLNSSLSVVTSYLNGLGADEHLRQTNATTGVSYFLTDHLGTTTTLTDATGNVVETLSYDSFGNNNGSTRTRYTYTGRERDPDTGLLFYRARYYDPQLGRFLSEDPISFSGGDVNLFGYVKNGPLLFRDPTGLQRCDPVVGALVGAGVGAVVGTVVGAITGPTIGATIGTLTFGVLGTAVEPGGGTLVGAGAGTASGAATGAVVGPIVGGVAGAGVGGYVGHRICSGGTKTCTPPKSTPIPVPPPPLTQPTPCPACPAPPPIQVHRVPPSKPHFPCPGDHWHYFVYNQNPITCQCFLQRKFGGCCGTPGAPC